MQPTLISIHDLATVCGGQSPNAQKDTIGVSVGDATVGMTKEGARSNYALCLTGGLEAKWTPEQIAATCGTPPAS
jgi:hypothetical protein